MWQKPTSAFNLVFAGFVGGMAIASLATRFSPPPQPVYMTGEQSIREWIALEGLPVLRAQSESFVRDYSELDASLAKGQGPSEEFCQSRKRELKARVKLHETVTARDKDVDTGVLKTKRLRTAFEETEHDRVANLQDSLVLLCDLQDAEKAAGRAKKSMDELIRNFKP